MCHPGFVDAELKRLDPLTTLREREFAYFNSDEFAHVLAAEARHWPHRNGGAASAARSTALGFVFDGGM